MNEELDSQLSAMFDDELVPEECELLARRPYKVAMVAFAAKTARIIWAMLVKGEPYRERASAPAAA